MFRKFLKIFFLAQTLFLIYQVFFGREKHLYRGRGISGIFSGLSRIFTSRRF